MANLKFYGKVVEILQPQTGKNRNGEQWWSQGFIVEELGSQYPSKAHFVLFGDKLTEANVGKLVLNNDVTVLFNINSKLRTSMDGNTWYSTELRAWKIEQGDTTKEDRPVKQQDGEFKPVFATTQQTIPSALNNYNDTF